MTQLRVLASIAIRHIGMAPPPARAIPQRLARSISLRPLFHAVPFGAFVVWASIIFSGQTAAAGGPAAEPVSARVRHGAHPLLIRKEHNTLLRISVDPGGKGDIRFGSLAVSLAGTDDLADIESLTLFSAGEKGDFSTNEPVAGPVAPQGSLTLSVDRPLSLGPNRFWLAVKLKPTANLSHRILARCRELTTSAGVIRPTDETEPVAHRIGVAVRQHKEDGVHTSRIPALATTTKGTLLAVYDMRRRMGRDLQEDIDIGLSRSVDGGQSFEPTRVIMDMGEYGGLPQEQNGCSDPGILVDQQTGEIFCFALWMNGKPGKHQWVGDGSEPGFDIGKTAQFMVVRSRDDGKSWSKPENLTRKLKQEAWWLFAPAPQQGLSLADGTLVVPAQGRDEKGVPFATLMTSRDHGASWSVGNPAASKVNECQAAQLGDGSIMLNLRNDSERFRAVYTTRDLGQNWTEHPTSRRELIEPNCNGSLYRMADPTDPAKQRGLLLFANPHTQKGRTHHALSVSLDDGASWSPTRRWLLDEGPGAGYPSLSRVDDDHVGIVYEGSQAQLVFERIPLRELAAPRPDATRAPGTTSLTNSYVAFSEPKEHFITLERGGVTAVVVDNDAIETGVAAGHKAGYSGLAHLSREGMQGNLFAPGYCGLNFEHIHDGTRTVDQERFEPRKAPMTLRRVDAFTVELHQPPTPNWRLESVGRYRLLDDGVIEYTFECIPREPTFSQGYVGLFWASYMNAPEDKAIHFLGRPASAPEEAPSWIRWLPESHGVDSTHPPAGPLPDLKLAPEFSLTLVNHPSRFVHTASWFYGVRDGFAYVQMFRPRDRIWIAQSPTGGGPTNPAWDFQWFTSGAEVGQPHGFVMRAAVVPFSTRERLEWDMEEHFIALGIRRLEE